LKIKVTNKELEERGEKLDSKETKKRNYHFTGSFFQMICLMQNEKYI